MNYKTSGVDIEKGEAIAEYLGMKDYASTFYAGGEKVVRRRDGVGP